MRLTDIIVKRLPAPSAAKVIYDETVKGFGVRVTRAGARAFVLNYRRKSDGRERRYTIGSYPDWGAAAGAGAKRLKREIDGGDPIGELEISRGAPTVIDLCTRFLEDHLPRVRPRSVRDLSSAGQHRHLASARSHEGRCQAMPTSTPFTARSARERRPCQPRAGVPLEDVLVVGALGLAQR